jgi:hypothetical protein
MLILFIATIGTKSAIHRDSATLRTNRCLCFLYLLQTFLTQEKTILFADDASGWEEYIYNLLADFTKMRVHL